MPQIGETDLHVWTYNLEVDREILAQQEDILSDDEWRRVKRFTSAELARRFIVRRGFLRRILGNYLDLRPEEIIFVYGAHGKPFLAPELFSSLQFSLSDSGEMAALVVGLKDPLGIDIERLRPVKTSGFAELHGSPVRDEEHHKGTPAPTDSLTFFQGWTRREALAKAEGVGLPILSGQSETDGLLVDEPPTATAEGAPSRRSFHSHALTLPAGYVGTLAALPRMPKIAYCSL